MTLRVSGHSITDSSQAKCDRAQELIAHENFAFSHADLPLISFSPLCPCDSRHARVGGGWWCTSSHVLLRTQYFVQYAVKDPCGWTERFASYLGLDLIESIFGTM